LIRRGKEGEEMRKRRGKEWGRDEENIDAILL
jgi:hypothetical protein